MSIAEPFRRNPMRAFTTRPEIRGTFGVVASTHWIASAVGMSILEKGGNAFDAAAAAGFTLQVVEPHLNGPLGEAPILVWSEANLRCDMICGQGVAPAAATIGRFRQLGLDLIPGTGLLAAAVPAAFGAWMRLLRDYGTMPLAEIRPGDRLCRERLPCGPSDGHDNRHRRRAVPPGMAEFRRSLPAERRAAPTGPSVPQPGSCSGLPPHSFRSRRWRPRGPDRARPPGVVQRICRRGDRSLLPA